MTKLGESSAEIGEVIKDITSIAQQTNLLALNATIEAARAGEAGKGFAVVAGEVKELAEQTAKATDNIQVRIAAIQADTTGAVDAIEEISNVIAKIDEISSAIAAAIEEQTATTNEIARSVAQAARGSMEITGDISSVASSTAETSSAAGDALSAARDLTGMAEQLRDLVSHFQIHDQKGHGNGNRGLRLAGSTNR